MSEKYVKLKHVQELIKLINIRNGFEFWMDEYEKQDRKVNNTIEWIERNAKELGEDEKTKKTFVEAWEENHDHELMDKINKDVEKQMIRRGLIKGEKDE